MGKSLTTEHANELIVCNCTAMRIENVQSFPGW